MGNLYLLHVEPRLHHGGHYLGFTKFKDVERRVADHLAGHGSKFTKAALSAGCTLTLVSQAVGNRDQERRIKRISRLWMWCPVCCQRRGFTPRKLNERIKPNGVRSTRRRRSA